MTILRECVFFASLLSAAAHLSTQAYNPQTLRVLPSSPCEFEYCYDAIISRVGNITNDARASPRDVPGLYLIPAKDLLLQVVQPERCFMACLSRVSSTGSMHSTKYACHDRMRICNCHHTSCTMCLLVSVHTSECAMYYIAGCHLCAGCIC